MTEVTISDHPILNLPRVAYALSLHESEEREDVSIVVEIKTFKDSEEVHSKIVTLLANNSTKVDNEGNILVVNDEGNYPEGAIGQYDYLKAAINSGINYYTLKKLHITQADQRGRFN